MVTEQELEQARQHVRELEAQFARQGVEEAAEIEKAAAARRAREKSDEQQAKFLRADSSDEQLVALARVIGYQAAVPRWFAERLLLCERDIRRVERLTSFYEEAIENLEARMKKLE